MDGMYEYLYGMFCVGLGVPVFVWLAWRWVMRMDWTKWWDEWSTRIRTNIDEQMEQTRMILKRRKRNG